MNYRFESTEKLIEAYITECKRVNRYDREVAQKLIKQELLERAKRTIRILEDEENLNFDLKYKTIEEEAQGILRHVWLMG